MVQTELPGMPEEEAPIRRLRVTVSFDTESRFDDAGVMLVVGEPRVLRLFPFSGLTVDRVMEYPPEKEDES